MRYICTVRTQYRVCVCNQLLVCIQRHDSGRALPKDSYSRPGPALSRGATRRSAVTVRLYPITPDTRCRWLAGKATFWKNPFSPVYSPLTGSVNPLPKRQHGAPGPCVYTVIYEIWGSYHLQPRRRETSTPSHKAQRGYLPSATYILRPYNQPSPVVMPFLYLSTLPFEGIPTSDVISLGSNIDWLSERERRT